jgi:hypothetical protein
MSRYQLPKYPKSGSCEGNSEQARLDEVSDSFTRIRAKYLKLLEILKMTPVFI